MVQPVYVGGNENDEGGASTISVTHGQTILAGDLVCFYINANGTGSVTVDPDSGGAWTQLVEEIPPGETAVLAFAFKTATATEPDTYTATLSPADRYNATIQVFRGAGGPWQVNAAAKTSHSGGSDRDLTANWGDQVIAANAVSIAGSGMDGSNNLNIYEEVDRGFVGADILGNNGRGRQITAVSYRIHDAPLVVPSNDLITFTNRDNAGRGDTSYGLHVSFVEAGAPEPPEPAEPKRRFLGIPKAYWQNPDGSLKKTEEQALAEALQSLVQAPAPITGSGSFAGSGDVQADGRIEKFGSGAFAGSATTAADGRVVSGASGSFAGSAVFQADGRIGGVPQPGSGQFDGTSAFVADGVLVKRGAGSFAGAAAVSANGRRIKRGAGSFVGAATAQADGRVTSGTSGSFAGTSAIQADGRVVRVYRDNANFAANSAFQGDGRIGGAQDGSGTFAGTSAMSAAGRQLYRSTGSFAGSSIFSGNGIIPSQTIGPIDKPGLVSGSPQPGLTSKSPKRGVIGSQGGL